IHRSTLHTTYPPPCTYPTLFRTASRLDNAARARGIATTAPGGVRHVLGTRSIRTRPRGRRSCPRSRALGTHALQSRGLCATARRSEEHTSELSHLVISYAVVFLY